MSKMLPDLSLENDDSWTVTMEQEEEVEEGEDKSQICCLTGYLVGITAGVLFIIVVPLGFLFVVYGRNNDSPSYLVTGTLFLILPFLLFGVFGMIVQCRQESQMEEKTQIKTEQPIERILTTTWLAGLQISESLFGPELTLFRPVFMKIAFETTRIKHPDTFVK